MRVADYIADQLFRAGVRQFYGIPGGPSIPYMEAFKERGIEFILVSHEASAAIMADVSARLTGVPGVCHATFGPGATNISTGVGGALLDRSPVIVFTSEIDNGMIHRTVQMNIDHQKLFEPITRGTFRLDAANAQEVMSKAIKICREELPGPVHIGLPSDVAHNEVIENDPGPHGKPVDVFQNDTENIIELLQKSRRPILAVGLTAKRLVIKEDLLNFLGTHQIPVVVTPMAKGIIPEAHPMYAGVLFHALSDYLEELYENRDLVIGLGYDPVEYNYESWIPGVPLIHFGTRPTDLPLREKMFQYSGEPDEWFKMLDHFNAGLLAPVRGQIAGIRDEIISVINGFTNHFGPVSALSVLREELPDGSIVTADVGSHLHLIGQMWDPGITGELIMTNGWSGMGFGIPAALAASIQRPGSTVVCVTGDGGFLMMAGEVVTAKRNNLPVIIVVLSDGELNLIKLKQSWKEIPSYGTRLYHDDLFGSDTFLGVKVLRADSDDTMRNSVRLALTMNQPVILNAVIDPEDYRWLVVKKQV